MMMKTMLTLLKTIKDIYKKMKPEEKFVAAVTILIVLGLSLTALMSPGIAPEPSDLGSVEEFPLFSEEELILGAEQPSSWFSYNEFTGFKTKADPTKLDNGANPNGQNTVINDGDRVSVRTFGNTIFGAASTTETFVGGLHTFRRRDGENIMMRGVGIFLEYYEENNDTWEILLPTSTSPFYGFADYNINTDLKSYTYFGNGTDAFSRWSGNHVGLHADGVTSTATFVLTDTTTGIGFPDTGTLIYCGQSIAYTAVEAGGFQVGSSHACAADKGVAEFPDQFSDKIQGNIYTVANNRLFIAGIASTTQAVYFSKYGDALDFVGAALITSSTADAAGIFNLGEGGGGITGLALDEGSIYIFKRSLIYKATLDGDGIYTLVPLKPFDGKSQTTGAVSSGSVFTGGNGVFFITPDNQIMNLSRISTVDYPQIVPISDVIKPTVNAVRMASSTGIFFKNQAFISVQSDSEVGRNDAVFLWNDIISAWESPIIGWNASVFTIYDDGDGEALYFGDSRVAQVYKVTSSAIDNELGVTSNWRSKQFTFGTAEELKEVDNFYIEGYISDNTTLSISLLYDENGDTQIYTTEFSGTETSFMFDAPEFNLFGFHAFGFERFGSSEVPDNNKFRIYLNKSLRRVPFYNLQLELASDGVGQSWEVTNYGFHVRRSTQPEKRGLYRAF